MGFNSGFKGLILHFIRRIRILSQMGENHGTDLLTFLETMQPIPRLPCLTSFPE